jgi:transcriptional regulator with XRE-family HTH domain
MGRRGRFSGEPFGPTVEELMHETGTTYRALAERTGLSAGYLNHLVHGNRPVPANEVIGTLAKALGVESDHFLEFRVRAVATRLETMPDVVNRLYRRYRS